MHGHILDPRTGEPATGPASVTVLAPTAADADALSTAFFLLGRKRPGPTRQTIRTWVSCSFKKTRRSRYPTFCPSA